MSSNPNDPFEGNGPSPYMDPSQSSPKKSRRGCLIGCTAISLLTMLVCCGGGYWIMSFVSGEMSREVQRRLAGNPVVEEHIGEVQSVSLEILETSRQTQKAQEDGKKGVLVFSLEGSKSSGQLRVDQNDSNEPDFSSALLVMPDGSRYQIDASSETDLDGMDFDDLEMELGDMIDSGDPQLEPPTLDLPDQPDDTDQPDEATDPAETPDTPASPEANDPVPNADVTEESTAEPAPTKSSPL